MIAELALDNAQGAYYDATNPPVITAKLSPGNFGNGVVQAFEEFAYYGNPNEGTGLQFLGDKNSPDIRFVAEPGNDALWIDRTTVPDKVDFAEAVLTAENRKASLIINANKRGGEYDDVQFVFKRASENPTNATPGTWNDTIDPNRAKGWVEYDPGKSYAEAHATFKNTEGLSLANTAFYVTSTERGDMFNDVPVMMTMSDTQTEPIEVVYDMATKELRVSLHSGMVGPPRDPDDPTTIIDDPTDPAWYKQIDTNDLKRNFLMPRTDARRTFTMRPTKCGNRARSNSRTATSWTNTRPPRMTERARLTPLVCV